LEGRGAALCQEAAAKLHGFLREASLEQYADAMVQASYAADRHRDSDNEWPSMLRACDKQMPVNESFLMYWLNDNNTDDVKTRKYVKTRGEQESQPVSFHGHS